MKNFFKKLFFLVASFIILMQLGTTKVSAEANLDEIEDYTITVNAREDGTLDIRYDIEWKVLSDKNGSEPLTWVKVGIPNSHCDSVEAITDNIEKARYYYDGGEVIRVDFTEKHYEGDVFTFSFTIHQSYMYMLEDDAIKYSFTAGWFEDIVVKKITIKWNKLWVEESTATEVSEEGKYLVWRGENLPEGDHFSTSVRYPKGTFATDDNQQYVERSSGDSDSEGATILIVLAGVLIVLFIIYMIIIFFDDYSGGSGFGGGSSHSTFISSCARSSCACVSSCACACACAGGGRAGCSTKDFYDGRTKVNKDIGLDLTIFDKVLEEDIRK